MSTDIANITTYPKLMRDIIDVNIVGNVQSIDWWGIISVLLSAIALAISIYSIKVAKTTHRATLASAVFSSIFQPYLVDIIPKGREKISFPDGKIKGHKGLVDDLNALRRKILYFKYTDSEFYEELHEEIQAIENHIVEAMNLKHDSTAQSKFYSVLDDKLANVFGKINSRHMGV